MRGCCITILFTVICYEFWKHSYSSFQSLLILKLCTQVNPFLNVQDCDLLCGSGTMTTNLHVPKIYHVFKRIWSMIIIMNIDEKKNLDRNRIHPLPSCNLSAQINSHVALKPRGHRYSRNVLHSLESSCVREYNDSKIVPHKRSIWLGTTDFQWDHSFG